MRLRRETGDYNFTIKSNAAQLKKGLNAEEFVGAIVEIGTAFEVVTKVVDNTTTYTLTVESGTLTYTKATGAVAYTAAT